jgi:hypothetical protein
VGDMDIFEEYYAAVKNKPTNLSFTARELALFYYADRQPSPESFLVYKVLALGG